MLEKGKSICEEVSACKKCDKVVFSWNKAPEKHHCGEKKCSTCGHYIPVEGKEHQCFLKKLKKHPLADFEKEDMEVDPSHENDDKLHSDPDDNDDDDEESSDKEKEPKEISVYYFDTEAENSGEHTCNCMINQEGSEKKIFYGKSALQDFIAWLLEQKNCTFIAHNFSGYNSYFILRGLVDEGICPSITPRGSKILSLG